MIPIADVLREHGLDSAIDVLPVLSGYPSPKYINLVLRRLGGRTYLFESSASRADIVADVQAKLDALGVDRLDAMLITHCHGDHGGSAGIQLAEVEPKASGRRSICTQPGTGFSPSRTCGFSTRRTRSFSRVLTGACSSTAA